ncbi:MAG: ABC transporter ATP-binding protein [Treponema sp.]|jgi:simple sugar transport system ATP-binding protein|nr:ABC transporter ATP-binding protein [Treponema sp.]
MQNDTACAAELKNISKQYSGSTKIANNNISLDLQKGEVLCIAGENGAGKTTLMKILMGLETPDAGEIFINGKKEIINSPLAAKELGIGMVHQHFMLFGEYTVAQNIVMGIEPRKWAVFYDTKKANNAAEKIINDHGFSIKGSQKVKDLTLGQMQQVEICRVLHRNAQIIIMDEPTSILTEKETDSLFETIKSLVSEGKSIILITHKLHEIKKCCDRVAVLRRGKLTGIKDASGMDEHEIARMMMGEDLIFFKTTQIEKKDKSFNAEPVITFDNVTLRRKRQKNPLLDKVSFSVREGEILGFAGTGGNGLGVIEALLGGFFSPSEGKILHRGKDISTLGTRKLREEGLSYVPADRLRIGSAGDATIEENMIINRRHDFIKGMINGKRTAKNFIKKLAEDYNIENADGKEKCSVLSGGNLQKMILAREIDCIKDYIVFSEPTWGLDVASSSFIMKKILEIRSRGAAVLLISTNMEEIIALSDRIIVMYKGKIAGEFVNTRDESIKEKVGLCFRKPQAAAI